MMLGQEEDIILERLNGENSMIELLSLQPINQDAPWSHSKRKFKSEKTFKAFKRYSVRTNDTARRILGFKILNVIVEEYFKNLA